MMFSPTNISKFFAVALAGESATYDDHNWYTNTGLKGYIKDKYGSRYSLLNKDLSKYTIAEIMEFQSRSRDNVGQLWATGRYQIIPNTLKGIVAKADGVTTSSKYDKTTQDRLGMALIQERSDIWKYINHKVEDTQANLEKASLRMAQIWSSIGVPYAMEGRYGWINKNQSYYSGGGDKAHVTTEAVQNALRVLRKSYGQVETIRKNTLKIAVATLVLGALTFTTIYMIKKLKKR